ncbi:MAG TPA: FmdB family zinc ribbon protein [Microlunatus sp.]|nr:FmdB family zinc ribbon protein [Microlunatus sp.]
MPTYQYRCTQCGNQLEVVQKFSDPALTTCTECQGALRKVYNAVGVVFKGSGFYRTDSRAGGKDKTPVSAASPGGSAEKTAAAKDSSSPATGSSSNGSSGGSSSGGAASPSGSRTASTSSTAA